MEVKTHTWILDDADSADRELNDRKGLKLNPLWKGACGDFNPREGEEIEGHLGHGTENEAILKPPHELKTRLSFLCSQRGAWSAKNGENGYVGRWEYKPRAVETEEGVRLMNLRRHEKGKNMKRGWMENTKEIWKTFGLVEILEMWVRWFRCKCSNHQSVTVLPKLEELTMNYLLAPRTHCFYLFHEVASDNVGVFVYKINAPKSFHVYSSMATAFAIIMADFVGIDFSNFIPFNNLK